MKETKITDKIWYVGVNDRRKELFENNWPLPFGVSYNSYLIDDTKSALIDTVEIGSCNDYIEKIGRILNGKKLDYLIINHLEPDHAGMISAVKASYPDVTLVGNAQTFKILQHYYPIDQQHFLLVKDGDTLDLGESVLQFVLVPWVHWPETMVTYEVSTQTLFSCDAFGGFGTIDGGLFDTNNNFDEFYLSEMRRYYSNIVGKYSNMVQKAFAKLQGVPVKMIAPSHGLIWKNPGKVMELYNNWSTYKSEKGVVVIYASMYGNTAQMADYIGNLIGSKGIEVRTFDVSKTHVSFLLNEIWKYNGLVLGTCAYNTKMHPMMEHLCNEIDLSQPKEKKVALFGTSTWNGAGVKDLKKFAEEYAGFEIMPTVVETFGSVSPQKVEKEIEAMVEELIAKL